MNGAGGVGGVGGGVAGGDKALTYAEGLRTRHSNMTARENTQQTMLRRSWYFGSRATLFAGLLNAVEIGARGAREKDDFANYTLAGFVTSAVFTAGGLARHCCPFTFDLCCYDGLLDSSLCCLSFFIPTQRGVTLSTSKAWFSIWFKIRRPWHASLPPFLLSCRIPPKY